MAKLELPDTSGAVQEPQPLSIRYDQRMMTAGADIGQVQEQAGRQIEAQGQQYFDHAKGAIQDAVYNKAFSGASTEFAQRVQQRMMQTTDANGNPNFQTLNSDIAQIGNDVQNKYGAALIDPSVSGKFTQSMMTLQTNHQLMAMNVARQQQQDFGTAALNQTTQSNVNNALQGDPKNQDFYYNQQVQQNNAAVSNGTISATEGQKRNELARKSIYYNGLQLQNEKDPRAVQVALTMQNNDDLHITPEERYNLTHQNNTALNQQAAKAEQQQRATTAVKKAAMNQNYWDINTGIAKGTEDENTITNAFNQGKIDPIQRDHALIDYYKANKGAAKQAQDNIAIANNIQQGGSLSNFNDKQLNNYFNGQKALLKGKNGEEPSFMDQAKIGITMPKPAPDFINSIEGAIKSGKPEDAVAAVNALNAVRDKNPTGAQLKDKQAYSISAYISEESKYTQNDPLAVVQAARAAVFAPPDVIKQREVNYHNQAEFQQADTKNTKNNIDKTIEGMYGLDKGAGKNVDPQVKTVLQDLLYHAYSALGDSTKAIAQVKAETANTMGVTKVNGQNSLMLNPPEKLFDGKYADKMDDNFKSFMKENNVPDGAQFHQDAISAGNPNNPSYGVIGHDGLPVMKDGHVLRWQPDENELKAKQIDDVTQRQTQDLNNKNHDKIMTLNPEAMGQKTTAQPEKMSMTTPRPNPIPADNRTAAVNNIASGIAQLESGDKKRGIPLDYSAMGVPVHHGDQALGAYQIMRSNLPSWSKEAVGRVVSEREFMSNPALQDKIAKFQMGQIYDKYGTVGDVASVWHSGRPMSKSQNARDVGTGMMTRDYVKTVQNTVGSSVGKGQGMTDNMPNMDNQLSKDPQHQGGYRGGAIDSTSQNLSSKAIPNGAPTMGISSSGFNDDNPNMEGKGDEGEAGISTPSDLAGIKDPVIHTDYEGMQKYEDQAVGAINARIPQSERNDTADPILSTHGNRTNLSMTSISNPQTASLYATQAGQALSQYTISKVGTRYHMGDPSDKNSASGKIDCSGWVAENTLQAMSSINQQAGKNIYDVPEMRNAMHNDAADIVAYFGKTAGWYSHDDVQSGNLAPGTVIGITRATVPDFARGRPMGISHIVQVVEKDGEKYISQSAGSVGGVNLTPYKDWISHQGNVKLYATNPFNMVKVQ